MVNFGSSIKEILPVWIYLKGHIPNIQIHRKCKHKLHVLRQITQTHTHAQVDKYIHKSTETFPDFLYLVRTV